MPEFSPDVSFLMDFQKSTLDNGLRVVTCAMPHTHSVSLSVFVGAGSRYEPLENAGISHFVEHLLFKGTTRRASPRELAEAIEGVGGVINGATDRELTTYWSKVARPHFPLALDVLLDMLHHSKFEPEELEKERRVIIEELNMTLDSPSELVDMLIDEVLWPEQPLGRDVAGTKESVGAISRLAMLDYLGSQYTPGNLVLSVAGAASHEEVVESLQSTLGEWRQGVSQPWHPARNGQDAPRWQIKYRNTEQAHLCLAARGLSTVHPDRYVLDLLNVILGEGMSSRLFLEVREKRGLAYDVHSYVTHFLDTGAITVYAGVQPKQVYSALQAILEELARLKTGVPEGELQKVKEFTKGRLLLRMEDSRNVSSWMGAQEMLLGKIRSMEEVVALIDAITPRDIQRVAAELLVTDKLNLAVVGPFRGEGRFVRQLKL